MEVVNANRNFRRAVLLFSLLFALGTLVILAVNPANCPGADLTFACWLVFIIHCTLFLLMMMQFIGLAFCLKKMYKCLAVFYFLIVATMFFVQMILWQGENCMGEATLMWSWLVIQIVLFYFIVAYGLAVWGSYICYTADQHEEEREEALRSYGPYDHYA